MAGLAQSVHGGQHVWHEGRLSVAWKCSASVGLFGRNMLYCVCRHAQFGGLQGMVAAWTCRVTHESAVARVCTFYSVGQMFQAPSPVVHGAAAVGSCAVVAGCCACAPSSLCTHRVAVVLACRLLCAVRRRLITSILRFGLKTPVVVRQWVGEQLSCVWVTGC